MVLVGYKRGILETIEELCSTMLNSFIIECEPGQECPPSDKNLLKRTDLALVDLTGIQYDNIPLIEKIREQYPGKHLIAITYEVKPSENRHLKSLGIDHHFSLGRILIELDELVEKIDKEITQ